MVRSHHGPPFALRRSHRHLHAHADLPPQGAAPSQFATTLRTIPMRSSRRSPSLCATAPGPASRPRNVAPPQAHVPPRRCERRAPAAQASVGSPAIAFQKAGRITAARKGPPCNALRRAVNLCCSDRRWFSVRCGCRRIVQRLLQSGQEPEDDMGQQNDVNRQRAQHRSAPRRPQPQAASRGRALENARATSP